MNEKIKPMGKQDPCICGSKKAWGQCCGQQLNDKEVFTVHVPLTGEQAIRFFLASLSTGDMYKDDAGDVVVFTNRAQALSLNEKVMDQGFMLVGMGESKWKLFQAEISNHVVITDAVA